MTLVVTHANGFLGCFTKEADGTMRQRALIDTGDEPPTPEALATLGEGLAEQWKWNGYGALSSAPAPKALPRATSTKSRPTAGNFKKKTRYQKHPTDPPVAERPALVLDYVRMHPYSTLTEILDGLGLADDKSRSGRWHHTMHAMIAAGQIKRRPRGSSKTVKEWFIP